MKKIANVVAMPLSTEQNAHTSTTRPTIDVRRPRSASRPAGSSRMTPAIAEAVGMAPATVSLKWKWSWIAGSAPATRLYSTRSMKATSAITAAAHQPKGAAFVRSMATGGLPGKASTSISWAFSWAISGSVASDIRPAPIVRGTRVRGCDVERRSYIGVCMSIVRVAAVQFAVTEDVEENLATCLRMTDQAAAEGAQVVVLPEFCNHVSWYDHRDPAVAPSPVVDTVFGRVGLYSCMDGVINETPRMLAVGGAQVLLNSLNSFALDEASLHVPVRAVENRVWVVAANKVGPLVPARSIAMVAERVGVPMEMLHGAGESQIVAPDGTVVAVAPRTGEAVVVADIEVEQADDKRRPDGTDVMSSRRPGLYGPIVEAPRGRQRPAGADELVTAVVSPV